MNKISSNLGDLDNLHAVYDWIPGSDQIRPVLNLKQAKVELVKKLESEWESFPDYILHNVFEVPFYVRASGKKRSSRHEDISGRVKFLPNEFPYQVGPNGHHHVLWFGSASCPWSDDEISSRIQFELMRLVKGSKFLFAWYENPKMTVPEFYHVQVFWTTSI